MGRIRSLKLPSWKRIRNKTIRIQNTDFMTIYRQSTDPIGPGIAGGQPEEGKHCCTDGTLLILSLFTFNPRTPLAQAELEASQKKANTAVQTVNRTEHC